jgi:transcription elongation factor GreA-like protein
MDIDKLTLELLMNKTTYQKYVEKTDPKKFEENRTYKEKVELYKSRILEITKEYLENPDKQVSLDMNHAFYEYSKSCIRHFEDVDVNAIDDDTLFDEPEKPSLDKPSKKSSRINHFGMTMGKPKMKEESTME